jgi:hypothetical protein
MLHGLTIIIDKGTAFNFKMPEALAIQTKLWRK